MFQIGLNIYTFMGTHNPRNLFSCPYPETVDELQLRNMFPELDTQYKWGVKYFDGQMDDCRMGMELVLTSTQDEYVEGFKGANVLNYTKLMALTKNEQGRIVGATLKDKLSGEEFQVKCKSIVNATGTGSDIIRKMDDPLAKSRMVFSRGSHFVLPAQFCSRSHGLLIPKTFDGRILFMLPWQRGTVVGTTDDRVFQNQQHPTPTLEGKYSLTKIIDFFRSFDYRKDYEALLHSSPEKTYRSDSYFLVGWSPSTCNLGRRTRRS